MDTVFSLQKYENLRLVGFFTGITILISLLCFQGVSIYASDVYIAKKSLPEKNFMPQQLKEKIFTDFTPEIRKQKFEESIKQKYPKGVLYDVSDGVKHIKLTKYYSGRPVKINVVSLCAFHF